MEPLESVAFKEIPEIYFAVAARTALLSGGGLEQKYLSITRGLFDEGHKVLASRESFSATALESTARRETKKPDTIIALERLLQESYGKPAQITSIETLPSSRKEVREVRYLLDDGPYLFKAWVIKADPVTTAKELAFYAVASTHGIPTARPVGYTPPEGGGKYPYDIAVLGGIVEHAGEPYKQLIGFLRLRPERIFSTAQVIARTIAEYQLTLTAAKKELASLGVALERVSPTHELVTRFAAGARIPEERIAKLARACEALWKRQEGPLVVSHGDIHTGNIVTVTSNGEPHITRLDTFGIIDWGSACLDTPASDLVDFWVHHTRETERMCDYPYTYDDVLPAYEKRFAERAEELGIACAPSGRHDARIQQALWHLYEMFDPTRKNEEDAREKTAYHLRHATEALQMLSTTGFSEARTIQQQVRTFLNKQRRRDK